MASLDFDESDERMFRHSAEGYGAEVYGGTPDDREAALREYLDEPFAIADGRDIDSDDAFIEAVITSALDIDSSELEGQRLSIISMERALVESGKNLLILEFDSMESELQTDVAQTMKGVAESRRFEGFIGYSCEEGGAVVNAEFDLSARIRSWELE